MAKMINPKLELNNNKKSAAPKYTIAAYDSTQQVMIHLFTIFTTKHNMHDHKYCQKQPVNTKRNAS